MNSTEPTQPSRRRKSNALAILAGWCVLAMLCILLVASLHPVSLERSPGSSVANLEQASLAAESAVAAAEGLLMNISNRPAYLVGLAGGNMELGIAPCLVIGTTNLTNKTQLLPLFSHNPAETATYPRLPEETVENLLEARLSTNPNETVDLNDSRFVEQSGGGDNNGGIIAATGHYPALWQKIRNSEKNVVGRYAFVLLDESARLNPLIHTGNPRNDPVDWDKGPADLSITNSEAGLFTSDEATKLHRIAETLPTQGSFAAAFEDPSEYEQKRNLLTRDPCLAPDIIPVGLPDGGLPKYNLNDLATNPVWGKTPYDRAETIARVIDRNLPKFKQRDASLSGRGEDPRLYLRRLACSIVDYISRLPGPTGPPGGEPAGRDLVPLVTQIAECCTRTAITSNSVTIESRYFVEVWNPTTSTIPAGGIPRIVIGNRARLIFGNALAEPFIDYDKSALALRALRPNEFTVIAFDPMWQTWISPVATSVPPHWSKGPGGNADAIHHQSFKFFWNGSLVDMTRPPKTPQDVIAGGLHHLGQTLENAIPRWQCTTIPTWSATADSYNNPDSADEALQPGSYRFVGDPRATFLTAYKWNVATNYPSKTLWNGISQAGILGRGYIMDPAATWTRRDRVPVDPYNGNAPDSENQMPDQIATSYQVGGVGAEAPFVIRKGPMVSLGELGNIFDPAQVDDLLQAPIAGTPASPFCSGGGRTLKIGQPEFQSPDPTANWDTGGKRAIELLDLFTVSDVGRQFPTNRVSTNAGIPGRININTAPHAVLTALFNGIAVTSDNRFTNSMIRQDKADQLATFVEKNRPFAKLSDLRILSPMLCNSETFSPPLSQNVPGISPPIADVFDRAREEAFGKVIGHCILQTRVFRLVAIGESLDPKGKTTGRSLVEMLVRVTPDESGNLVPSLQDVQWH